MSLLLLAAPESGKTTITAAADARHVRRVAIITGRSILRELKDNPETEFLLFNDLTAIRAMSPTAVALLIVLLNQLVQDERGVVAFAGKEAEEITRPVGIIGCLPFETFTDHRARWKELGFVSRMIPIAYKYPADLVAEIKDTIDTGHHSARKKPRRKMPRIFRSPIEIECDDKHARKIRALADARSISLGQIGIRLLRNYHSITRAHALLNLRRAVTDPDIDFLREVDRYVSIKNCETLKQSAQ